MGCEIREVPYKKGPKAGQMAPPRLFMSKGAKLPSENAYRLTQKTARLVLKYVGNIQKFLDYCDGKVAAAVTTEIRPVEQPQAVAPVQVAADKTTEIAALIAKLQELKAARTKKPELNDLI